jgi:hypothetical protein
MVTLVVVAVVIRIQKGKKEAHLDCPDRLLRLVRPRSLTWWSGADGG